MTRDGTDSVIRYGGEEFLAILPDTGLEGGIRFAERLRTQFAATASSSTDGSSKVTTTASFGVASAELSEDGAGPTLHDLISAADKLMYEAKRGGRDCVRSMRLG
jgi:diguanylate cyclase (GGDEF)-like protein